jgi:hypothetical protein
MDARRLASLVVATLLASGAPPAHAQERLGRVAAIYVAHSSNLMIDPRLMKSRDSAHLVAEVVTRNDDGSPGKARFARVGDHPVEVGDIVLVASDEAVLPQPARLPRASPRITRIEAKFGEDLARRFFQPPSRLLDLAQSR